MRPSRRRPQRLAEYYPFHSKREFDELKRVAGLAVRAALAKGTLQRQPCQTCGLRAEAHHDDYSKPLDVMWLCRYHHRHRDADLREQRRATVKRVSELPVAYLQRQQKKALEQARGPYSTHRSQTPWRTLVSRNYTIALVKQATFVIAEALELRGISENRLARKMGVSRQAINLQFAGGMRSLRVLAAYADALNCDAHFVLRARPPLQDRVSA